MMQKEKNENTQLVNQILAITDHWNLHFSEIEDYPSKFWRLLMVLVESESMDDHDIRFSNADFIDNIRTHFDLFNELHKELKQVTIIDAPPPTLGEQRN